MPRSARVSRSVEGRPLIRNRESTIVILALLTLLVAQSAAGLHALKHVGPGGEPKGLPGQHTQVCLECTSFAPLAGAHGGPATSLVVAHLAAARPPLLPESPRTGRRHQASYQSRAPPR